MAGLVEGDGLFVEDRMGDEAVARQMARSHRMKRPLRSMEGLQSSSAVPALTGRAKRGQQSRDVEGPKGMLTTEEKRRVRLNRISKSQKEELKRMAGHVIQGPFGAIVEGEQGRVRDAAADASSDVWKGETSSGGSAEEPEQGTDEWLRNAQREFNKVSRIRVRVARAVCWDC